MRKRLPNAGTHGCVPASRIAAGVLTRRARNGQAYSAPADQPQSQCVCRDTERSTLSQRVYGIYTHKNLLLKKKRDSLESLMYAVRIAYGVSTGTVEVDHVA